MDHLDPLIVKEFGPPPPDVDLSEEQETGNAVITGVLLSLAILSVLARWASLRISGTRLHVDDYTIFVALALCIATAVVNVLYFRLAGIGHHIWVLEGHTPDSGQKMLFVYAIVWICSVSVTKLSIILLYRRIFTVQRSAFRLWLDALTCITVCLFVAYMVANLTVCRPLSFLWTSLQPDAHGSCFNYKLFMFVSAVLNSCVDILILVTPVARVWSLHMSFKMKIGVCGMFLLGSLVCFASWIRVYHLRPSHSSVDITWVVAPPATWSFIETSLGIVSACLPLMRPLYRRVCDSWFPFRKTSGKDLGIGHACAGTGARVTSWQPNSPRNAADRQGPHDAAQLTTFVSGGKSAQSSESDGILVRSEVRQVDSFV